MSAPGPLPWMLFRGKEIGNAARTMEYLRDSSLAVGWEVAEEYPCSVLYRTAGESGASTFTGPASDPAPWYDLAWEESARFLGLLIEDILGLDSNVARSASARRGGIGGAQLGPQTARPREVTVTGMLVAEDSLALEYGFHWLTEWLAAANCEACELATVEVYGGCPPDNGTFDYQTHYFLYDVGLVSGPRRRELPVSAGACRLLPIEFNLVAENPYLYREANVCLPAEVVGANIACSGNPMTFYLGDPGTAHSCALSIPQLGTLGIVVTIVSPDGVGGLELGLYDTATILPETVALKRIYVDALEPGETLIVDSARRKVTLISGGVEYDGTARLNIPVNETIQWLEVSDCDSTVMRAAIRTTHPCSQGGATTGEIKTQLRLR